jgi:hypothetical protein
MPRIRPATDFVCLGHERCAPARRFLATALLALTLAGCEPQAQSQPPAAGTTAKPQTAPTKAAPSSPFSREQPKSVVEQPKPRPNPTFSDLVATARATEFDLPKLEEGKIAAAGIRRLEGQHLVLYTDLPTANDVDELPRVFDAAVPLWCSYFAIEPSKLADWKLVASVMKDKERFVGAGLYPQSLPDFHYGFNIGSQIWVYEQQSAYYRRHLLLHEGTHAFMLRWLRGAGPPWYMEGMAELLATHRWESGKLTLGIMPARKEDVPYWGRIKIIKDEVAAGRPLSLIDIMRYDAHAHLQVEAYAWCWAASSFLDQHPLTQSPFRALKTDTRDRTLEFSNRFYEQVKEHWPAIVEDWQIFIFECDYGYDIPRATVQRELTQRKPTVELPPSGATIKLATDRGWQSTGYRLEAGKTYRITAAGQYVLATAPKPWPCDAGGVTIHYCRGKPLGMLLASLGDLDGETPAITPLVTPQPIGLTAEIEPTTSGTLYLKINEPSSGLADNSGTLSVTIRAK